MKQKGFDMKHLKAFALFPAILVLLTALTGCGAYVYDSDESDETQPRANNNSWNSPWENSATEIPSVDEELFVMVKIGEDDYFNYYRDTITDVLYLYRRGGEGGLTAMLDPETGLPLTYTRYLALASDELGVDVTETTP